MIIHPPNLSRGIDCTCKQYFPANHHAKLKQTEIPASTIRNGGPALILKRADDKSVQLAALQAQRSVQGLPAAVQRQLDDELMRVRRGHEGEKEAAFYIDSHLADKRNTVVIHDLRLEVDGEVAQIDHLVVTRLMTFFLIETKNFNGNLTINDLGEFSVRYATGNHFGIPSPIEQSRRHEKVLLRLVEQLGMLGRLGMKPTIQHLVLVHPKATITRSKKFDSSIVIKADAMPSWFDKWLNQDPTLSETVTGLLSLRSKSTFDEWMQKLVACHKPAPLPKPRAQLQSDSLSPSPKQALPELAPAAMPEDPLRRKLICATCSAQISFAEGRFCWNNEKRFGGLQYCRTHQQSAEAKPG
jgi:hypothetical protein